jgi:hypothetical protein
MYMFFFVRSNLGSIAYMEQVEQTQVVKFEPAHVKQEEALKEARSKERIEAEQVHQALIKGINPYQLQAAKETQVFFAYDLPGGKPDSRAINRDAIKAHASVLKAILPLGSLNKSTINEGLACYYKTVGIKFPTVTRMMDQSWALKRMMTDCFAIHNNSPTRARLQPWLQELLQVLQIQQPGGQAQVRKGDPKKNSQQEEVTASTPTTATKRKLFRMGSTPPSVKVRVRQSSPEVQLFDAYSKDDLFAESPKPPESAESEADEMVEEEDEGEEEEEDEQPQILNQSVESHQCFWSHEVDCGVVVNGTTGKSQLSFNESCSSNGFVKCHFASGKEAELKRYAIWESEITYLEYQGYNKTKKKPAAATDIQRKPAGLVHNIDKKPAGAPIKGGAVKEAASKGKDDPAKFRHSEWKRRHSQAFHGAISKARMQHLSNEQMLGLRVKMIKNAKMLFMKEHPP